MIIMAGDREQESRMTEQELRVIRTYSIESR